MFAGTLTQTKARDIVSFNGKLHARDFDIAIALNPVAKTSPKSPDFEVTAINRTRRTIRIGSAWDQISDKTGNRYISLQVDVGNGPFRVNAVQTEEARKAKSNDFDIIPFVANSVMKSGSISGELTAMDADNAFAGYVANMMFDLNFMLIENDYKTAEKHPDYRIEISSPNGTAIRVGSAWLATSEKTGNDYISLLINTPDGDLRVNAVQNEEQRGGDTFSIIPFVEAGETVGSATGGLALVA